MENDGSKMATYRLHHKTIKTLNSASEAWRGSKAHVLESAVKLIGNLRFKAILGDSEQSIEQALVAWSVHVERGAKRVCEHLCRNEWNLLAEVHRGITPTFTMQGAWAASNPLSMCIANLEDAHIVDEVGFKWLGEDGDILVKDLVRKLDNLDPVEGWAVIIAIEFFWQHASEIDHLEDEWWTVEHRKKILKVEKI